LDCPHNADVSDREELHRSWVGWVTTNLGRDSDRASRAANAAVEMILSGHGYNAAVPAAQSAWAISSPAFSHPPTEEPPTSADVGLDRNSRRRTRTLMNARLFAFLGAALTLIYFGIIGLADPLLDPWSALLGGLLVSGGSPVAAIAAGIDKPSRSRAALLGYAAVGVLATFLQLSVILHVDWSLVSVLETLVLMLAVCALIISTVLSTREHPRGAIGIIVSTVIGGIVGIAVLSLIIFATGPMPIGF
jgi:hypothetical protein